MDINIIEDNGVIKIIISGSADMAGMKELSAAIDSAAEADRSVEIDLGSVDYLDSSCIGLLIKLNKIKKDQGLDFKITAASERVSSLLSLCSLSDTLNA